MQIALHKRRYIGASAFVNFERRFPITELAAPSPGVGVREGPGDACEQPARRIDPPEL
jgi:hypothetical protein